MSEQVNELERVQEELQLRRIAGTAQVIEINERALECVRQEFAKKGLVVESKDYPQDDFIQIAKLKEFDALVDHTQGIKKVIGSWLGNQ